MSAVPQKEKIIQEIDFEELNKKIYALVTSYLIRKGCLKRGKGFGTLWWVIISLDSH